MLVELRVTDLGVIEDQAVLLGPGMTALTGETGAGKTLLVDAIALLAGGPADPAMVAPGAVEARVEARFSSVCLPPEEPEGSPVEVDEVVLSRVVPAQGRSRCYIDGRMTALARFAEIGHALVDIHGQHAHQSLLAPAAQRRALDRAGRIDTSDVAQARQAVRSLRQAQAQLGGDPRERARQLDVLTYQLHELDRAGLEDPGEEDSLAAEAEVLADASGLIEAAQGVWLGLSGDGGLVEGLGDLVAVADGRPVLAPLHDRLLAVQEELTEIGADARHRAETVEDDPARLAAVGERRHVLTELRRKYGTTLEEVIAYRESLRLQVEQLASHDRRAAALEAELRGAESALGEAQLRLAEARRKTAPQLAEAVEAELQLLAMPRARFAIEVGEDPGREEVTWMLSANPGQPMQPLAKVASGGELARAMLATRLVVSAMERGGEPTKAGGRGAQAKTTPETEGPGTLIFDEVDAGIGGEAALAVGRALAGVAAHAQVLVVTHLAQVAAFASSHLQVTKEVVGASDQEKTVAATRTVDGQGRVIELARMLSGQPDSDSARRHAEELLGTAAGAHGSTRSRARRR